MMLSTRPRPTSGMPAAAPPCSGLSACAAACSPTRRPTVPSCPQPLSRSSWHDRRTRHLRRLRAGPLRLDADRILHQPAGPADPRLGRVLPPGLAPAAVRPCALCRAARRHRDYRNPTRLVTRQSLFSLPHLALEPPLFVLVLHLVVL